MRVRLLVQRYDLPRTQLLWNTTGIGPDHGAGGDNATVAQLLEQVNSVIPLEGDDWGYEDYVVEVAGFECLHFCVLNEILKENDPVTIRPLQEIERKKRRKSGRDQITADGRHLLDGVPFGRPFLRRLERPHIRIPSAKRARLEPPRDGDSDGAPETNQLVLHDAAEEYIGFEDEYEGMEDGNLDALLIGENHGRLRSSRKRRRAGLGIENDEMNTALQEGGALVNGYRNSRRSSRSSTKSVRFGGDIMETPATLMAVEDSNESDDDDFNPHEAEGTSDSSDKENVEPQSKGVALDVPDSDETSSSEPSSSSESEASDVSQTSASSGTNSGPDSDAAESPEDDSDETSDEDSEANSVSSSELTSPELPLDAEDQDVQDQSQETLDTSQDAAEESRDTEEKPQELSNGLTFKDDAHVQHMAPPGQGTKGTKSRNARRKMRRALEYLKSEGTLPETATLVEYKQYLESVEPEGFGGVKHDDYTGAVENDSDVAAIEARKAALLHSLDTEKPQVEKQTYFTSPGNRSFIPSSGLPQDPQARELNTKTSEAPEVPPHATLENAMESPTQPCETDVTEAVSGAEAAPKPRRMRLDVAATRRFILSSLNLNGNARKAKPENTAANHDVPSNQEKEPEHPQEARAAHEEPVGVGAAEDAWKEKIDLRAVECCQDGIELSTPPFPFHQRWDPQQQKHRVSKGHVNGRSRRKKRKTNPVRNYESYGYEKYDYEGYDYDAPELYHAPDDSAVIQDANSSRGTQAAVDNQLLQNTHVSTINRSEPDDLPPLPADLSTCKDLTRADAAKGAVIAFKHIYVSQATNWSPFVSEYKTAAIEEISKDGALEMTLARRDAPPPEKRFDPVTGKRVYDKFEMPSDEGSAENDDGRYLALPLEEMIEAKLIVAGWKEGDGAYGEESHDQRNAQSSPKDEHTTAEPDFAGAPSNPELTRDPIKPHDDSLQSFVEDHNIPPKSSQQSGPPTATVADIAGEDRDEYSLLIRQAGFRQEIYGEITGGLNMPANTPPKADHEPVAYPSVQLSSPHPDDASPFSPPSESHNASPASQGTQSRAPSEAAGAANLGELIEDPSLFSNGAEHEPSIFNEISESQGNEISNDIELPPPESSRQVETSGVAPEDDHDAQHQPRRRTRASTQRLRREESQASEHRAQRQTNITGSSPKVIIPTSPDMEFASPSALLAQSRNKSGFLLINSGSAHDDEEPELPASSPIQKTRKRTRQSRAAEEEELDLDFDPAIGFNNDPRRESKTKGNKAVTKKASKRQSSIGSDKDSRNSRVVDLTLSSDRSEPEDSDEEEADARTRSQRLPKGPGWVRKSLGLDPKKTQLKRARSSV